MLSLRLRLIIIIVIGVAFVVLLNMVKKKAIELKFALPWFLSLASLLAFVLAPKLLGELSNSMGIILPVNMIFFIGFIFSISITFALTVSLSKLSKRVQKLVQYIAILEMKIENEK